MQLKTLLLGACTAAFACAQSTVLSFTRVPNPVTAGQANAITYATNDTSAPVSIILRRGVSTNLNTIETLTSDATGGQYVWTPSKSLENGDDYALEIKQGTQVNYYGPFTIQGGGASSSSSAASSTGTATATASRNGTASAYPTHSGNSTVTGSSNATMSMTRTRSHSTLNPATITSTSVQTAVTTPETASTGGAGFQGTSSQAPTSTGAAAAFQTAGSMLLLGLGAILFA